MAEQKREARLRADFPAVDVLLAVIRLSRGKPVSLELSARTQSLLLFPEGQQALRGGAADHAGDADRDLAKRRRRDAAQRNRADPDLTPEVEIAPAIRALGLELFHGGERILADRAELHGVGGLDHLAERSLDGRRLSRQLAAEILAQSSIADRVARQRIARHAADGQ